MSRFGVALCFLNLPYFRLVFLGQCAVPGVFHGSFTSTRILRTHRRSFWGEGHPRVVLSRLLWPYPTGTSSPTRFSSRSQRQYTKEPGNEFHLTQHNITLLVFRFLQLNPFTASQCEISPAASPEVLHHTVWGTWLDHTTNSHFQEWSMSNFPCSLTRSITSHSMENLAFHSLRRWQMIILPILTTSLIHISLKGWENVLFELGSERVKLVHLLSQQRSNKMKYRELLAQRAQQFRAIERRLLTRFKDKTPAPLANLDTLLDGTYRQVLWLHPELSLRFGVEAWENRVGGSRWSRRGEIDHSWEWKG